MQPLPDDCQREPAGDASHQCKAADLALDGNFCGLAQALICSRQSISPKHLHDPGPSAWAIERLLNAAAAAPDHGLLIPWRFVIVPHEKRMLLGEAFALSLTDRDPNATPDQITSAREKAHRAPFLMLAIVRLGSDGSGIPEMERVVSLGCALQNMMLMAHVLGFGSGLTSGRAMNSDHIRRLFTVSESEQAICCLNVGTVGKVKPQRVRSEPKEFTSTL